MKLNIQIMKTDRLILTMQQDWILESIIVTAYTIDLLPYFLTLLILELNKSTLVMVH